MTVAPAKAVFFDVDFTLICPGPTFQGEGYAAFPHAVVAAASMLTVDDGDDHVYSSAVFVRYTRRIIEAMGGTGEGLEACAQEIYEEWAACQHFFLYDDVTPALRELAARGLKIGLISNSHRCLVSFQEHFGLQGLVAAAVSSSEHGYLKPHPSIFHSALRLAGVAPHESVMVGDSLPHDIEGARRVGMRGILVQRSPGTSHPPADVPVICDLSELSRLI
jgi:putative hydrolase of the HAD superfamily